MRGLAGCSSMFSVLILLASQGVSQGTEKEGTITLSSPAFENRQAIPSKHGCDGANVNPPLQIEDVPPAAKSLALILDDRDAPRGTYVHWILWNIDPAAREIRENSVPAGAIQGKNDFQKNDYGGPCPPTRPHRYVFKIYALDVRLDLGRESTKRDLEKAMKGRVIGRGELEGVYKREKRKK